MKRYLFILSTFILLSGCFNLSEPQIENKSLNTKQDSIDLCGLWVMPSYVDSIIAYKTISKYRMQWPTWFAILIDIDKDTLRTYGSIIDIEAAYDYDNDTICVFKRTVTGEWTLTFNKVTRKLELRNTNSGRSENDNKIYVLEKRPELRHLLDTLNRVHKTRTSFTNFFNDKLFSATYKIVLPKDKKGQKVIFKPDGTVNFMGFDTYEVGVYFGTSHPFKNKDLITFSNTDDKINSWKPYNWVFNEDTLILTNFIREKIIIKGEEVVTDDWILGDEQIELLRE